MNGRRRGERARTPLIAINGPTAPRVDDPSLAEHGVEVRIVPVLIGASSWSPSSVFFSEGAEA